MWSPTILPNHRHSWLRGFNVVAWLSAGSGSDVPCIEMDANADSRYVRQRRDWNKNARRTMVSPRGCRSSNKTLMSQVSGLSRGTLSGINQSLVTPYSYLESRVGGSAEMPTQT